MKKFLLALSIILSVNVNAAVIKIELDASDYQVGDTISGQLVASEFSTLLGSFFAILTYDTSAVSALDWSYGVGFDDGKGSAQDPDVDIVPGELFFDEFVEFDFGKFPVFGADTDILSAAQGSAFVLANFTFKALAIGDYDLSLDSFALSDLDFFDVATTAENASFTINEVPEPATIAIFALAFMLLSINRKQRKN